MATSHAATPEPEPGDALLDLSDALLWLRDNHYSLSSRELAGATREALAIMQIAETTVVELTTAALSRGLVNESTAAGATGWIKHLAAGDRLDALLPVDSATSAAPLVRYDGPESSPDGGDEASSKPLGILADESRHAVPGIEPTHAARLAAVATGCTLMRNEIMRRALLAGRVNVPTARTALTQVDAARLVLPAATRDEVFGHFLAIGPGVTSKHVRELTMRLKLRFGDPEQVEHDDEAMDAVKSLQWQPLPNGLTRLVADLSREHAASIRNAIDALSAPAPANTCCDNPFHRHRGEASGEADGRPARKRRADALTMLVTKAAELIDADPQVTTSGAATLVVTVDYETLAAKLATDDQLGGFGRTAAGDTIGATYVRQLACEADIIPMVLGSRSQPLDVGRKQRLVSNELRAAVIQRDRQCTFPGCDRPPGWCQVHHVTPWQAGGETSLLNSALLCQRHHTTVHRYGYTADVSDERVNWNLQTGRMAGRQSA